jgi:hypothetical protein
MAGLENFVFESTSSTRDSPSPDRPSRGERTVIITIAVSKTTNHSQLASNAQRLSVVSASRQVLFCSCKPHHSPVLIRAWYLAAFSSIIARTSKRTEYSAVRQNAGP